MDRYCEIPVEKMTNRDHLKAMVHRMDIMGGTHVWPEFGRFAAAFENRSVGVADHMWLYDIHCHHIVMCPEDKDRSKKEGRPCPDYHQMWQIPLHWLSEGHLYSILVTLKDACKTQLTTKAYAEVLNEIGETPTNQD